MTHEIRLNEDGSLDEVVGEGQYHLEQMDRTQWFLQVGKTRVFLHSRCRISATWEDEET